MIAQWVGSDRGIKALSSTSRMLQRVLLVVAALASIVSVAQAVEAGPEADLRRKRLERMMDKGAADDRPKLRVPESVAGAVVVPTRGVAPWYEGWEITQRPFNSPSVSTWGFSDIQQDLVGGLFVSGGLQDGSTRRGFVTKFDVKRLQGVGSLPAGAEEWAFISTYPDQQEIQRIAVDSSGKTYVATEGRDLLQLTPNGSQNWELPVSGIAYQLELDPEEQPILGDGASPPGVSRFFDGGAQRWRTEIPVPFDQIAIIRDLATDSVGDVYAVVEHERFGPYLRWFKLYKFRGRSGSIAWERDVTEQFNPTVAQNTTARVAVDQDGCPVVFTDSGEPVEIVVRKYAPNGDLIWSRTRADTPVGGPGTAKLGEAVIDDEGRSFVLLYADRNSPTVWAIDGNGADLWEITPDTSAPSGLAFRRGDLVAARGERGLMVSAEWRTVASGGQTVNWIARLNRSTGALERELQIQGGSVAEKLLWQPDGSIVLMFQSSVAQLLQDPPSFPAVHKANPNLSIENRSIWAPGVGSLEASDRWLTTSDLNWKLPVSVGGSYDTFLFGTFGGGINFNTSGRGTLGYRAEVNGGTADLHLPLDISWTVPPEDTLLPSSIPTIMSEWSVDPSARLTSCFTPDLNAGLTGTIDAGVYMDLFLEAFSYDLLDEIVLNEQVNFGNPDGPAIQDDYIEIPIPFADPIPLSVQGLLALGGFPNTQGEWFEYETTNYGFKFRTPQILAQAPYDAGLNAMMTSSRDRIMVGEANATNIIAQSLGVPPLIFEYPETPPDPNPNDDEEPEDPFGKAKVALAQTYAQINFDALQDITVDQITPMVRYELRYQDGTVTTLPDQPLGQPFDVPMNGSTEVFVTPHVWVRTTFNNTTKVGLVPGVRLELLKVSAAFQFEGFELFSASECFVCEQEDLPLSIELTVFDDSWQVDIPGQTLTPFPITAEEFMKPKLFAASRTGVDLIIPDQLGPADQAQFNLAVNRTTRMVLYGEEFRTSPSNVRTRARVAHFGREELIADASFQVLSESVAVVDIPNRFFLLPGVMRIWTENDIGCSASVDLEVRYPRPQLATVNPNLWAADPQLADVPIQVIDRKTTRGTDTFIARRDYFVRMRDQLWNSSTAGGIGAAAYFPAFDFNQMPGFPAVTFGGSVLPRFPQPIDSGVHNLRLDETDYDEPAWIPVRLRNPGPGGGPGNTLDFAVAAPMPVVESITPAEIAPGGVSDSGADGFQIIVHGPKNVPIDTGFEEPKFGNFNADSVVLIDGFELETEYINQEEIRAFVPNWLVSHVGPRDVSVFTPSNGTEYFEELREDSDGDGEPDGIIFQGFVPSGGESNIAVLEVRYPTPTIERISPRNTRTNNPLYLGSAVGASDYNLTLVGTNFRPGATVTIDGQVRAVLQNPEDPTIIRIAVSPQDIREPGLRRIVVSFPGVAGGSSVEVDWPVLLPGWESPSDRNQSGVGP